MYSSYIFGIPRVYRILLYIWFPRTLLVLTLDLVKTRSVAMGGKMAMMWCTCCREVRLLGILQYVVCTATIVPFVVNRWCPELKCLAECEVQCTRSYWVGGYMGRCHPWQRIHSWQIKSICMADNAGYAGVLNVVSYHITLPKIMVWVCS